MNPAGTTRRQTSGLKVTVYRFRQNRRAGPGRPGCKSNAFAAEINKRRCGTSARRDQPVMADLADSADIAPSTSTIDADKNEHRTVRGRAEGGTCGDRGATFNLLVPLRATRIVAALLACCARIGSEAHTPSIIPSRSVCLAASLGRLSSSHDLQGPARDVRRLLGSYAPGSGTLTRRRCPTCQTDPAAGRPRARRRALQTPRDVTRRSYMGNLMAVARKGVTT
jgi:hypothetical protein